VPLGEPVADDFDFLHETLFAHPTAWLGGGGMPLYWRPLSRQLYYMVIAPFALSTPWLVAVLQAALLVLAGMLLYRALRPAWPAWAAAAAGTAAIALEAARELVTWSSAAQDLLALVCGMAMLLALSRGRRALALAWLGLALLCKESSLTFAITLPLWPALRTRYGGVAGLRDRAWAAYQVMFVTAAWWSLHEWVSRRAGLLPPPHGSGDAIGLPARLAWATKGLALESVSARHPASAMAPWLAAAIALLVAFALVAALRRERGAPAAERTLPWLAWGFVWSATAVLPLAWFMPAWGCHRAVMPALGLSLAAVAALRGLGPWPVALFTALRVVVLLWLPPAPARIPLTGTYTEFDFDRLATLQRFARELRTASLRSTPTLPHSARIVRYQWPRMSELAFEGSKAFQVWYRDSTLRVVGQDELDREPFGHADLAVAFEPLRTPQVAIISPRALKSVWDAKDQLGRGWLDGAVRALSDFEHEQSDTNAAGFIATGLGLRGVTLLARGQLDSAATVFEHALRLNPDDPNAHRLLAGIYDLRGERELEVLELQRHLAIVPGDAWARAELERLAGGSH
jgi:tetratricopeptide (TPR) repeat protein